jgi:hypothetical protein
MAGKHRKPEPPSKTGRIAAIAAAVGSMTVLPAISGLTASAQAAPDGVWDEIAKCESGGKWNTNTGNGYSGGLQFLPSTWRAYGGKGNPANASRSEQIRVAENVLAGQGWNAWPVCSKKAGARSYDASPNKPRKSSATSSRATMRSVDQVSPNRAAKKSASPEKRKRVAYRVVDSGRASDGTGTYTCDRGRLYFEACDPHNLGETVKYPKWD